MPEDRLNELRKRWEAEPGSRVFLQLAEEYRRLGRVDDAVKTLLQGLERSPNHLAAQVALGRCFLELEDHEKALAVLERVVDRDPTQLVANKLLVEAHLGLKDRGSAAVRLERYKLLNGSDPEIEELEERLAAMPSEEGAAEEPASSSLLEDVDLLELGADEEEPALPEAFEQGGDVDELKPTRPDPPQDDPFPELADGSMAGEYLTGLGGEGLFPVGEGGAEASAPPPEPFPDLTRESPDDSAAAASRAEGLGIGSSGQAPLAPPATERTADDEDLFALEGEPARTVSDEDDIFGLGQVQSQPSPSLEDPFPLAAEPPDRPDEIQEQAQRVDAGEPGEDVIFEIEEEEAPEVELAPEPPEEPDLEIEAAAEETAGEDLDEEAAEDSGVATVTLGQLYLDQGHRERARKIFLAVLDRDPDNEEAREGLRRSLRPPVVKAEPEAFAEVAAAGEEAAEAEASEPELFSPKPEPKAEPEAGEPGSMSGAEELAATADEAEPAVIDETEETGDTAEALELDVVAEVQEAGDTAEVLESAVVAEVQETGDTAEALESAAVAEAEETGDAAEALASAVVAEVQETVDAAEAVEPAHIAAAEEPGSAARAVDAGDVAEAAEPATGDEAGPRSRLTAADLVGVLPPSLTPVERKTRLLESYRRRLRGEA